MKAKFPTFTLDNSRNREREVKMRKGEDMCVVNHTRKKGKGALRGEMGFLRVKVWECSKTI